MKSSKVQKGKVLPLQSPPLHEEMANSSEKKQHDGQNAENRHGQISEEKEEQVDVLQRSKLDLSGHPLPPLQQLAATLSQFRNIKQLHLSMMKPSVEAGNPEGLTSLAWLGKAVQKSAREAKKQKSSDRSFFGHSLTMLKLNGNSSLGNSDNDELWDGLQHLHNLAVVNASSCSLPRLPPATVLMGWEALGALIFGHNQISEVTHIPFLPHLNTLVLSHNKITTIPHELPGNLPSLKKLSITNNELAWQGNLSPLPDFSVCSHLREVRVSGNDSLERLPQHISSWGKGVGDSQKGTGLEIFEASDCGLKDWRSIEPILLSEDTFPSNSINKILSIHPHRQRKRGLKSLLLKGNKVTELPDYKEKVLKALPTIKLLDNAKLAEALPKTDHSQNNIQSQQFEKDPLFSSKGFSESSTGGNLSELSLVQEDFQSSRKIHKRGRRGKGRSTQSDDITIHSEQDLEHARDRVNTPVQTSKTNKSSQDKSKLRKEQNNSKPSKIRPIGEDALSISKEEKSRKQEIKATNERSKKRAANADLRPSEHFKPAVKKIKTQESKMKPLTDTADEPQRSSVAKIVDVSRKKREKPQHNAKWDTLSGNGSLTLGQGGAWD